MYSVLQCEKCGSNVITYDTKTGKKTCNYCQSNNIEMISHYDYIKKYKRLQQKLDRLDLFPENATDEDEENF